MSGIVQIEISTNAQEILRGLAEFPREMAAEVAAALDYRNQLTIGYIQSRKLSVRGPETLGVVTNRLRGSVRAAQAVVRGMDVWSSIGTNVPYAGTHEFGFQGEVMVRAHTRHNPKGDRYSAGGKARFKGSTAKAMFGKRAALVKTVSGVSQVKAHRRKMNMPARQMFYRGISEQASFYAADLSQAIERAWSK